MSTKEQTTGSSSSTLQFNPLAQSIYNQLISGGGGAMTGFINAPFSNASYIQGADQSQAGAKAAGANMMNALTQNQKALGMGGQAGSGWLKAQQSQAGRAGQAISSQSNIANVMSAIQRQMMASGSGLNFSPQLTGQSGTFSQLQTKSGLGMYLPQILSGIGGGILGGMMGGGGGGSSSGSMFSPSPMANAGLGSAGAGGGMGNLMSVLGAQGGPPSFSYDPMFAGAMMGGGIGG